MILKKDFWNNVSEILELNKINKKYFQLLYDVYLGKKVNVDKDYLVDEIMKKLTPPYYTEPLIPFKFFDTPVGRVILEVKYGIKEKRIYYVSDIAKILKISKQAVLKKIHDEDIEAEKYGRNWGVEEERLNEYLVRKGMNPMSKETLYKYLEEEERMITPNFERETGYNYNNCSEDESIKYSEKTESNK